MKKSHMIILAIVAAGIGYYLYNKNNQAMLPPGQ